MGKGKIIEKRKKTSLDPFKKARRGKSSIRKMGFDKREVHGGDDSSKSMKGNREADVSGMRNSRKDIYIIIEEVISHIKKRKHRFRVREWKNKQIGGTGEVCLHHSSWKEGWK